MVDAYNFSDKSDLRHFISILLDDYCPYQLEKIDSDLIYDAIKKLRDEKLELTGNLIYMEAVCFGVSNADQQIRNWREYIDETEIAEEQIIILDKFANKLENGGLIENCIIDYFANGSLDSHVYFTPYISSEDKTALKILNANSDILKDLSDNISLDISDLEYNHEVVFDKDITEDY